MLISAKTCSPLYGEWVVTLEDLASDSQAPNARLLISRHPMHASNIPTTAAHAKEQSLAKTSEAFEAFSSPVQCPHAESPEALLNSLLTSLSGLSRTYGGAK